MYPESAGLFEDLAQWRIEEVPQRTQSAEPRPAAAARRAPRGLDSLQPRASRLEVRASTRARRVPNAPPPQLQSAIKVLSGWCRSVVMMLSGCDHDMLS
eukprot:4612969-Pyramimonas_sp.AAC.1